MNSLTASERPEIAETYGRLLSRGVAQWPEWIAISSYAALVSVGIAHHEPWADEAQAWQLARSLSLKHLLVDAVRYEGSPGLWHFLLWILIRLHVSYTGLHWICGAVAVLATSLLLFLSPLPRYLKLILPFTYFLLFQYAVVARSYVLVPLFLYLVAACWKRSPVLMAILLGLLANVCLHASVISGALAILYAIESFRAAGEPWFLKCRRLVVPAAVLICMYGLAIVTVWPPRDLSLSRVTGHSSFFVKALLSLVWGTLEPWWLSVIFWLSIVWYFVKRKCLIYLLPVAFFGIFSGVVYANWWHFGLPIPLLICLLWITWPEERDGRAVRAIALQSAMIVLIGIQLLWSAKAFAYDYTHLYSPDKTAAEFLQPLLGTSGEAVVTFAYPQNNHSFNAVGLLPYFDRPIFSNMKDTFWWWSERDATEKRFLEMLPSRPSIVVVETTQLEAKDPIDFTNPKFALLDRSGYKLARTFCGSMPMRFDIGLTNCHLIFEFTHPEPQPTQ